MAYGDEPAFNLQQVGKWIKGISESTKRPGTKPRWGGDSGGNNNPRPSQANGEPTVYAQHAGTEYRQTTDGRDVYVTNGVTYDSDTGQQVARPHGSDETGIHDGAFSYTPEDKYDAYKGTSIRNQDNQSIYEGTQVWKVPDSTGGGGGGASNSGRGDSRVSPTGVVQKGTNMSRSFNDLLATTNTSGYQPYSSNQLPTTAGSPDSGITPKTRAILAGSNPDTNIGPVANGQEYANNLGRQGTKGIGPVADGQVYGNVLENAPNAGTKGIGPLADGEAYAKAVEGKGKSTSRLDAALSDTAGINSYMSKFSSGDQERLANRAFLDTERSMEALRAKEAVNGVVFAQNQHYVAGENADSPAVAIDRSDARDISNNKAKAEQFKTKKVADTVAAIKQEPATIDKPDIKQDFGRTETISAPINTDVGGSVDFNSNNDNPLPGFNKTGGYKSGFKRIDTSMTNPFG